jgi:hypothetical protein
MDSYDARTVAQILSKNLGHDLEGIWVSYEIIERSKIQADKFERIKQVYLQQLQEHPEREMSSIEPILIRNFSSPIYIIHSLTSKDSNYLSFSLL